MILASILIGPLSLSPMVEENIASFKRLHPDYPHRLFRDADIIALLEERFSPEVLAAYQALRPAAYKADLARYCIIHEFGGIYADLTHLFIRPLPFDGEHPTVFRDLVGPAPWSTNTSVFAAPAGHPALKAAIEMVCANVRRRYYGPSFLCPTGPTLFGKAWAMATEADDLRTGFSQTYPAEFFAKRYPDIELPKAQNPSFHCLLMGLNIIAVKRKGLGHSGLSELGVVGSDSYIERWKARDVYA